jgi:nicotinamide riboside transporter PnuC
MLEMAATILVILAVLLIGQLNVFGQWLMLIAQTLWLSFAVYNGHMGLAAQSVVLFVLTIRAIWIWRKKLPSSSDAPAPVQ